MKKFNFGFATVPNKDKLLNNISLFNEEWKLCSEYDEYVSNFGRVCRFRDNDFVIAKLSKSSSGYYHVYVNKELIDIHRLVAIYFIPNPNNYKYINHKDEDKSNNRVDNLEWCDNKYNNTYGSKKKNVICKIDPNTKRIIEKYSDAVEAAKSVNGFNTSILKCCKRYPKHITSNGYIWRYEFDCEFTY